MNVAAALAGGLAGTVTVASIHEALKRITPDAPRMDLLDMELIRKGLQKLKKEIPPESELQRWAVAGELFADTGFFALAGIGGKKGVWLRGALLGLVAGVTAVVLPKPLGLPEESSNKTLATQLMTVGLYLIGGLVAAATIHLVDEVQRDHDHVEEVVE